MVTRQVGWVGKEVEGEIAIGPDMSTWAGGMGRSDSVTGLTRKRSATKRSDAKRSDTTRGTLEPGRRLGPMLEPAEG